MLPLRRLLAHHITTLLFATVYLVTPGRCAGDPGPISFTYPQATNNRFGIGDVVEVAWQFPNPGQYAFDLDLLLTNGTVIAPIARKYFDLKLSQIAEHIH